MYFNFTKFEFEFQISWRATDGGATYRLRRVPVSELMDLSDVTRCGTRSGSEKARWRRPCPCPAAIWLSQLFVNWKYDGCWVLWHEKAKT
jgi:hypothetical protein